MLTLQFFGLTFVSIASMCCTFEFSAADTISVSTLPSKTRAYADERLRTVLVSSDTGTLPRMANLLSSTQAPRVPSRLSKTSCSFPRCSAVMII